MRFSRMQKVLNDNQPSICIRILDKNNLEAMHYSFKCNLIVQAGLYIHPILKGLTFEGPHIRSQYLNGNPYVKALQCETQKIKLQLKGSLLFQDSLSQGSLFKSSYKSLTPHFRVHLSLHIMPLFLHKVIFSFDMIVVCHYQCHEHMTIRTMNSNLIIIAIRTLDFPLLMNHKGINNLQSNICPQFSSLPSLVNKDLHWWEVHVVFNHKCPHLRH